MKSISLDSPEIQNSGMNPSTDPRCTGANGLRHKNMSVPKIVADCQQNTESNPKNFGIGIGNRRYGAWANVVRSRMAAQQAAAATAAAASAGGEMAPPAPPAAHARNPHAQQLPSTRQVASTNCQLPPRRPPNSMEFGVAGSSAPPSYNQCNFHPFDVLLLTVNLSYM